MDSLKEGAQGYMVKSSLEISTETILSQILVVKYFSEVFPEDVLSLPLIRDMRFSI